MSLKKVGVFTDILLTMTFPTTVTFDATSVLVLEFSNRL